MVETQYSLMIQLSLIKEFFTIVRSNRRITVPPDFKEGEPIKIRIERLVKEDQVE